MAADPTEFQRLCSELTAAVARLNRLLAQLVAMTGGTDNGNTLIHQ